MRSSAKTLARVLTAGLLLLAAIVAAAPASAHDVDGHRHSSTISASVQPAVPTAVVNRMAVSSATIAAIRAVHPCGDHGGLGSHAGCCAESQCSASTGALVSPGNLLLPLPAIPCPPLPAASPDGVDTPPGERPPRRSI